MCDHALTRRGVLTGMATGMAAVVLPKLLWAGGAAHAAAPAISGDQAVRLLKEGNARFLAGKSERPNLTPQRIADTFANGQHPFVTIISCSDSRVPVEHIFDRGIGDLFVVRVAGNVADTDEIGTAEYGAGHLLTPLVLVLGHTQCGAVTAVVRGDQVGGSIPKLVDNIIPAAQRAKEKGLTGAELVLDAIRENVHQSISDLLVNSEELRHLEQTGKIRMAGAIYHVENGTVEWLGAEAQVVTPPPPPPTDTSATAAPTAEVQAEVEQTVQNWVRAWSAKQLDDYLGFYSTSAFVPDKFPNRAAWQTNRKQVLQAAGTIQVTLTDLQVVLTDAQHARVTFKQDYRSKIYRDQVKKTLVMQKEGNAWKITRESE
ncbi:MAG: carbonic anhydrase [Magnetococcus sp. DMHC-8]